MKNINTKDKLKIEDKNKIKANKKGKATKIIILIISIINILFTPFWVISFPIGALIYTISKDGLKDENSQLYKASLVISLIGLVFTYTFFQINFRINNFDFNY